MHLNIKKFVCKYCGVDYTTNNNLKKHIRKIHMAPPGETRRGAGRPPRIGKLLVPKVDGDL